MTHEISFHHDINFNFSIFFLLFVLSVYSILDSEQPISTVLINTGDVSVDASPSKYFVGAALGEVAVAFDFSRPITLQRNQPVVSRSTGLGGRALPPIEVWPVYCVRGNGAVMIVYSHLSDLRWYDQVAKISMHIGLIFFCLCLFCCCCFVLFIFFLGGGGVLFSFLFINCHV